MNKFLNHLKRTITIQFIIGVLIHSGLVYGSCRLVESIENVETRNIVILLCMVGLFIFIRISSKIVKKSWK